MTIANQIDQILANQGDTLTISRELLSEAAEELRQAEAVDIDEFTRQYMIDGQHCTPKELRILNALLSSPGKAIPAKRIMRAARIGSHESLWVHVTRLRKKLRDGYNIRTLNTVGYMLTTAAEETETDEER